MDSYTATGIAEGFIESSDEAEIIEAWQYLIDTGLAWRLQGWFGRTAQRLIDDGVCEPARSAQAAYACIKTPSCSLDVRLEPGRSAAQSLREWADEQKAKADRLDRMADLARQAAKQLEEAV